MFHVKNVKIFISIRSYLAVSFSGSTSTYVYEGVSFYYGSNDLAAQQNLING